MSEWRTSERKTKRRNKRREYYRKGSFRLRRNLLKEEIHSRMGKK